MPTLTHALFGACLLLATGAARAEDQTAVKELLDKVTKAYGGADQTAKLAAIAVRGKTSISEGGMDITFTFDVSLQGLGMMKMDMEANIGGMNKKMLMVFNGDKAWGRDADTGKTEEAPKEVAPIFRQVLTALRGAGHPNALKDGNVQLTHGGQGKVDDVEAEILRVNRKDCTEVTMYFDKKTGLPLKSETKIKEPPNENEVGLEFFYMDFKDVNGVKHPHRFKVTRDGKAVAEFELSEVKVGQKFDANTFDKP